MDTAVNVLGSELLNIIYFPLWWYTRGLLNWVKSCGHLVASADDSLGFSVWAKNILTPM